MFPDWLCLGEANNDDSDWCLAVPVASYELTFRAEPLHLIDLAAIMHCGTARVGPLEKFADLVLIRRGG